jgi:hypothetical protein
MPNPKTREAGVKLLGRTYGSSSKSRYSGSHGSLTRRKPFTGLDTCDAGGIQCTINPEAAIAPIMRR